MKSIKSVIFFVFISAAAFCFGQTGDLKIFSEIDSIEVYVDNEFKGIDTKLIKGLSTGSHYLKVVKDDAAIISELIQIKDGQEASILIKNSPDILNKIIEAKQEERDEYYKKKLTVLVDPNGVWQPFRGKDAISESDFALTVGDTATAQAILRRAQGSALWQNIGGVTCLTGLLSTTFFFVNLFLDTPLITFPSTDFEAVIGVASIMTGLLGYGILSVAGKGDSGKIMSYDKANESAKRYNEKLKEALGLPKEFDSK